MQVTYEDEELERLVDSSGYESSHLESGSAAAYRRRIQQLKAAKYYGDLSALKSLRLKKESKGQVGRWSLRIDARHRLILKFQKRNNDCVVAVITVEHN